ncbi:TPA: thioredoxin domain-containing protein [Escherichia coli]|nr:thioredoxin domain-containing protein [Escherichia coli]HAM3731006.1 thioredoxin domain-containing protein [Escherichia coli]HAM4871509.1 thioredoxin domain-containing protein [Escherichia coli]HAY0261346.1 thioredoxin domain-containing protein [Escherichia coli]
MYKRQLLPLILGLMLSGTAVAQAYTTYSVLDKPVTGTVQGNKTVVEFFSFYCPPCYAFSQGYGIDGAIRESLPAGGKMVKYHADFLGAQGSELTQAWSVAMLSGLEEKVEPLLFEATIVSRTLKRPEDIRAVFVKAGMPAEEYELMLASQEVADMTEKQRRLFKEYGVTGTPSIYVNGRYHIQNSAFQADSVEAFRKSYVAAVMSLLNRKDK